MIKCEGETKIQKKFDVDRKTLKAGLRKLRSLVKVKIRLAKEHGTVEVDQPPLPIVKSRYGEVLETVDDAENFFERELRRMHKVKLEEVPRVVFCAFDVIEGVKHEFEPEKYLYRSGAVPAGVKALTLDIMTDDHRENAVYIGEPSPEVSRDRWAGRVVSVLSRLLPECVEVGLLEDIRELEGVRVRIGKFTLLNYVTGAAMALSGARVEPEYRRVAQ
ncbi:hypothetical protein [Methanopyrus sp.]